MSKANIIPLSREQVLASRVLNGENTLPPKRTPTFLELYTSQFNDPLIQILCIALLVTFFLAVFGYASFMETVGIGASVLVASIVSTISEYKSENSFSVLQQQQASQTKSLVFRDHGSSSTTCPHDPIEMADHPCVNPHTSHAFSSQTDSSAFQMSHVVSALYRMWEQLVDMIGPQQQHHQRYHALTSSATNKYGSYGAGSDGDDSMGGGNDLGVIIYPDDERDGKRSGGDNTIGLSLSQSLSHPAELTHGFDAIGANPSRSSHAIQTPVATSTPAHQLVSLNIADIVVGDRILLQSGCLIPADGILIHGRVTVKQAALTGEDIGIEKHPHLWYAQHPEIFHASNHSGGDVQDYENDIHSLTNGASSGCPLAPDILPDPHDSTPGSHLLPFENDHTLFRGALVEEGEGILLVTKTGVKTVYGQSFSGSSSTLHQESHQKPPLQKKLGRLADFISQWAYRFAILIALIHLFQCIVLKNNWDYNLISDYFSHDLFRLVKDVIDSIMLSIIIIVVSVPEGLPMMIALVLSLNMNRLLAENVLVRRLIGIATSGSVSILFVDKTGTLTTGIMSVEEAIDGHLTHVMGTRPCLVSSINSPRLDIAMPVSSDQSQSPESTIPSSFSFQSRPSQSQLSFRSNDPYTALSYLCLRNSYGNAALATTQDDHQGAQHSSSLSSSGPQQTSITIESIPQSHDSFDMLDSIDQLSSLVTDDDVTDDCIGGNSTDRAIFRFTTRFDPYFTHLHHDSTVKTVLDVPFSSFRKYSARVVDVDSTWLDALGISDHLHVSNPDQQHIDHSFDFVLNGSERSSSTANIAKEMQSPQRASVAIVKGAVEFLLDKCTHFYYTETDQPTDRQRITRSPITREVRQSLQSFIDQKSSNGGRVIALATARYSPSHGASSVITGNTSSDALNTGVNASTTNNSNSTDNRASKNDVDLSKQLPSQMTLVMVCILSDTIRNSTPHAVQIGRTAGISVVMVTGDRIETSIKIGYLADLLSNDDNVGNIDQYLAPVLSPPALLGSPSKTSSLQITAHQQQVQPQANRTAILDLGLNIPGPNDHSDNTLISANNSNQIQDHSSKSSKSIQNTSSMDTNQSVNEIPLTADELAVYKQCPTLLQYAPQAVQRELSSHQPPESSFDSRFASPSLADEQQQDLFASVSPNHQRALLLPMPYLPLLIHCISKSHHKLALTSKHLSLLSLADIYVLLPKITIISRALPTDKVKLVLAAQVGPKSILSSPSNPSRDIPPLPRGMSVNGNQYYSFMVDPHSETVLVKFRRLGNRCIPYHHLSFTSLYRLFTSPNLIAPYQTFISNFPHDHSVLSQHTHSHDRFSSVTSGSILDQLYPHLPQIQLPEFASARPVPLTIPNAPVYVAAMAGDGANDAESLSLAQVSFAMGSATEIARGSSDILLLKDSLLCIMSSVWYGRSIFNNIRNFILFQVTVNSSICGLLLIGPFIHQEFPLTLSQLLFLNVIMDSLAVLAIANEPPKADLLTKRPLSPNASIINGRMYNSLFANSVFIFLLSAWFLSSTYTHTLFDRPLTPPLIWSLLGWEAASVSDSAIYTAGHTASTTAHHTDVFLTGFFSFFVFLCTFHIINVRTHHYNIFKNITSNLALCLIIPSILLIQILFTELPFFHPVLGTVPLTITEWTLVALLAILIVVFDSTRKFLLSLLIPQSQFDDGEIYDYDDGEQGGNDAHDDH